MRDELINIDTKILDEQNRYVEKNFFSQILKYIIIFLFLIIVLMLGFITYRKTSNYYNNNYNNNNNNYNNNNNNNNYNYKKSGKNMSRLNRLLTRHE